MGRLCKGSCACMLLACLTVGVLWAGSYHAKAILRLPVSAGSTRVEFYSYRGLFAVSTIADFPVNQGIETRLLETEPAREARWDALFWQDSFAGFSGEEGRIWVRAGDGEMVGKRWFNLMTPYWILLLLGLLGPAHEVYVAMRGHRRVNHGQCAVCGYETIGAPECPACAARRQVVGLTPRTHLA